MNNKTAGRLPPPGEEEKRQKAKQVFGFDGSILSFWPRLPIVEYLKAQFQFGLLLPA